MSLNIIYEKKIEDLYHSNTEFHPGRHLKCSPHLHQELELVYLRKGNSIAYSDGVRYELHPGDLFFTFPNQVHSYETFEQENYIIYIIKIGMLQELEKVFAVSLPETSVLRHVDQDPTLPFLIQKLSDACENSSGAPYEKQYKKGLLLAIYSTIFNLVPLKGIPRSDSDTLRTILHYCSQNYANTLSLSSLGDVLHLNKYYISHLFNEKLGIRFNDYIHSLRVSQACRYLNNSDYTITEIGSMVGYDTLRTFNRAFIRQTGCSPTEYRKNNRGSGNNQ